VEEKALNAANTLDESPFIPQAVER